MPSQKAGKDQERMYHDVSCVVSYDVSHECVRKPQIYQEASSCWFSPEFLVSSGSTSDWGKLVASFAPGMPSRADARKAGGGGGGGGGAGGVGRVGGGGGGQGLEFRVWGLGFKV